MFQFGKGRSDPLPEEKQPQARTAEKESAATSGGKGRAEGATDASAARRADARSKLRFEGTVQVEGTFSGEMLNALLGHDAEINGKLQFEGTVRIDGNFTGEIHTNDLLIVGDGATIAADIDCGSAVVSGAVSGNITARDSVELRPSARVKGDISAPALSVDKGAMFQGNSRMESAAPARRVERESDAKVSKLTA